MAETNRLGPCYVSQGAGGGMWLVAWVGWADAAPVVGRWENAVAGHCLVLREDGTFQLASAPGNRQKRVATGRFTHDGNLLVLDTAVIEAKRWVSPCRKSVRGESHVDTLPILGAELLRGQSVWSLRPVGDGVRLCATEEDCVQLASAPLPQTDSDKVTLQQVGGEWTSGADSLSVQWATDSVRYRLGTGVGVVTGPMQVSPFEGAGRWQPMIDAMWKSPGGAYLSELEWLGGTFTHRDPYGPHLMVSRSGEEVKLCLDERCQSFKPASGPDAER